MRKTIFFETPQEIHEACRNAFSATEAERRAADGFNKPFIDYEIVIVITLNTTSKDEIKFLNDTGEVDHNFAIAPEINWHGTDLIKEFIFNRASTNRTKDNFRINYGK